MSPLYRTPNQQLARWRGELMEARALMNYAREFLAEFEHMKCEDDCEGFRDPCRACIVHEALRRLGGGKRDAK